MIEEIKVKKAVSGYIFTLVIDGKEHLCLATNNGDTADTTRNVLVTFYAYLRHMVGEGAVPYKTVNSIIDTHKGDGDIGFPCPLPSSYSRNPNL
jgi:hypothetical protein